LSSATGGITAVAASAGLGAWICFEAAITDSLSVYAGTDLIFDFWGNESTQVDSGSADSDYAVYRMTGVSPRAGIVIRF
jgi:hypothetical protein